MHTWPALMVVITSRAACMPGACTWACVGVRGRAHIPPTAHALVRGWRMRLPTLRREVPLRVCVYSAPTCVHQSIPFFPFMDKTKVSGKHAALAHMQTCHALVEICLLLGAFLEKLDDKLFLTIVPPCQIHSAFWMGRVSGLCSARDTRGAGMGPQATRHSRRKSIAEQTCGVRPRPAAAVRCDTSVESCPIILNVC